MADTVRVGIVGTGRMAQAFAASLPHARGIELRAVASRQPESAKRFAARYPVTQTYAGLRALLEDEEVDLVYIATPHAMHCQDTLQSLDAGKGVLCEKPFAINAREAERMIGAARQADLFLMEAMWTRYIPAVARLRELLAQGVIGKLNLMVAGGAFMPDPDPNDYLFRPDLGGGVLLDAGVYLVSLASMLFGQPTEILATASLGQSGVDEHDAIMLRHADEALASLYVSLRTRRAPDVLLLGEGGRILVHPPLFAPQRLTLDIAGSHEPEVIDLPFAGNGYQFEAMEAANCMRDGRTESALMPLEETLQIMRTMDEIRRQINLKYPMEK